MTQKTELHDPLRFHEIRTLFEKKAAFKHFYERVYSWFKKNIDGLNAKPSGPIIEIGSGAGFIKEFIPEALTSDIVHYPGLDYVFDCQKMPFDDGSVQYFCLFNVFHHIPNVEIFLKECDRCLKSDGAILISDQHVGFISYFVLKYLHSEAFDSRRISWAFNSSGPLSGANGVLSWIVFQRDLEKFQSEFPSLKLKSYQTHSPLLYWLSGGLKKWSLAPRFLLFMIDKIENGLLNLSRDFGSFNFILIQKANLHPPVKQ